MTGKRSGTLIGRNEEKEKAREALQDERVYWKRERLKEDDI